MAILGYVLPPVLVVLFFTITYFVAETKKNYGYIDIVWGASFVISAWSALAITSLVNMAWPSIPAIVVAVAVTIWGLRLSTYLFKRNWNKPEDYRYVTMRNNLAGKKHPKLLAFIKIFMSQAGLSILISTVILVTLNGVVLASNLLVYSFVIAGGLLWIIGFFFESVGDAQLRSFIRNPENRGKIMDQGLWGITRHPNYFGEFCIWWGFYLIALAAGAWWSIVGPLLMTLLLLKVSGVALLEKDIGARRPDYADYIRRTNAFFPGKPRMEQSS